MRGAGSATIPMMVSIICHVPRPIAVDYHRPEILGRHSGRLSQLPHFLDITALTMMTFYLRGRWMHPKKRHKKPAKAEA